MGFSAYVYHWIRDRSMRDSFVAYFRAFTLDDSGLFNRGHSVAGISVLSALPPWTMVVVGTVPHSVVDIRVPEHFLRTFPAKFFSFTVEAIVI